MATIQSALKLSDGMTGPLQGIIKSMNLVISAMQQMQSVLDENEKISKTVDAAKSALVSSEAEIAKAIENSIEAQKKFNEEIIKQPARPSEPPVPPPTTWESWSSPEIFQSSGIERYTQEISALQEKVKSLAAAKQALDMSDAEFLPPEAVTDIGVLQQRLQQLGTLLQRVEMQKEELSQKSDPVAFDSLNASAEKIRVSIKQAVDEQEAMNRAMEAADLSGVEKAYRNLNRIIDETEVEIRNNTREQENFNRAVENGEKAASGLLGKIAAFAGAYLGGRAIKDFFQAGGAAAKTHIGVEQRLQTIMGNINGMTQDGIDLVKQRARELEKTPIAISATVGWAGQSQLAEYVYDPRNIADMTEAMYNLATETYGVNVSQEQLMQTANLMGKVMMGDINALSRNGFRIDAIFTEAEQQLLKTGDEAERAALVIEMIDENLAGLAEAMGNTPEGRAIKFANAWGSVQERIGYGVIPLLDELYTFFITNLPSIEIVFMNVFGGLITIIKKVATVGVNTANFLIENWSLISPIIGGLAGALGVAVVALVTFNTVTAVKNALLAISAARTALVSGLTIAQAAAAKTATGAQIGLNAAMLASPITWIILGIIAIIALIYLVVAAINKLAGTSYSATGMIAGAFFVLAAVIRNTVVGVINAVIQFLWTSFVEPFIAIIEWVLNVFKGGFDSFGDAVKNLLGQIISWFLSLGKVVTKIIDAIFGTDWTSGLSKLQDSVLAWGKNEEAITLSREAPTIESRIEYGAAWNAGYDWGENLGFKLDMDMFKPPEIPDVLAPGEWDVGDGTLINGGKLDEVGKIRDTVDISSEDLKTMRELAEMKNIQNFVTLTPQLSFGDTHIRQDGRSIEEIVANISEHMEQELAASARGVFNV